MFEDADWISDWPKASAFSLRVGSICATIPLRGDWEPDDRIAFAVASFQLAQQHHGSIHILSDNRRYSSANALARPLLEAGLRTLWLIEDASDQEIRAISTGRESALPLLGVLRDSLSKHSSEQALNGRYRGILDSLTHGGIVAMSAQFLDGEKLKISNAAMIAQAGYALCAAGYTIASVLKLQDIQAELDKAIPHI